VLAEKSTSLVPALLEAGAAFIGGCCGTGPEYIVDISRYF